LENIVVDHSTMKLGKGPAKHQPDRLMLRNYTASLPAPPASCDNTKGVTSFGTMLNNQLGDCTIAGLGHACQIHSGLWGIELTVPDATIEKYYELWDGYDPNATLVDGQNPTDQGGVEVDVLNDWRNSDFDGVKLLAYADPDPGDVLHVKQSIVTFGGVYIGLQLPLSAQTQDIWDVVTGDAGAPGSWGGHCVFCVGYDALGITCITWGQLKKMTWEFWAEYCDESHALYTNLWTPPGVDTAAMLADVELVAG
jgi:hypothetical protein